MANEKIEILAEYHNPSNPKIRVRVCRRLGTDGKRVPTRRVHFLTWKSWDSVQWVPFGTSIASRMLTETQAIDQAIFAVCL